MPSVCGSKDVFYVLCLCVWVVKWVSVFRVCVCVYVRVCVRHSIMSDSLQHHGL